MRFLPVLLVFCACAHAPGRAFSPARLDREAGWIATRPVPLIYQEGNMDCGPAAAAMLLAFWDRAEPAAAIRRESGVAPERGLTAQALRDHLRARGLTAYIIAGEIADLEHELAAGRPVLAGTLRKGPGGLLAHFQIVAAMNPKQKKIVVVDPADGWRELTIDAFDKIWAAARRPLIVAYPAQPMSRGGGFPSWP